MSAKHSRLRIRERGPSPLSGRTRRRLLGSLLRRADAGDVAAAEALVRLGADRDQTRRAEASVTAQGETSS